MIRIDFVSHHDFTDERPQSRGCGQVTYHQETRDPQLACIVLFVADSGLEHERTPHPFIADDFRL